MRATSGTTSEAPRVTVLEVPSGSEIDVFRIVRSNQKGDPAFLDSLRSHFELSHEPRKVERRWTVLHMGISVYMSHDQASQTARRWPKLGDYVARIELQADRGFNVARTGHAGHLTLWAEPVKLRDATVDIHTVVESP
jgi:hypothetical protein